MHLEPALASVRIPRPKGPPKRLPKRLACDRAYSSYRIRRFLRTKRITGVIPFPARHKLMKARYRSFDSEAYKGRNIVERLVGWLRESRRVATRFEKLAVNYLAIVKLAMIERCLRVRFSDRT